MPEIEEKPVKTIPTYYFSAETGGFYTDLLHGDNIPPGAIAITTEDYNALLNGQSSGKRIGLDKHGKPAALEIEYTADNKKVTLQNYRSLKETGGFEFNGISIPSDEKTERRIIGATVKAQKNPDYTIEDWTTDGGATVITLDAETIIAIGDAFDKHVQACFSAQVIVMGRLANYDTVKKITDAFDVQYQHFISQ